MLNDTDNNDLDSFETDHGTLNKFLLIGLSIVIALLLVSVGFLGRLITEPTSVTNVIESTSPSGIDQTSPDLITSTALDVDFDILGEILLILEDDYVEPERVESEYMHSAAINGMFEALDDPHTAYIPPSSFALSRDDFFGAFQGIGATVNKPVGSDFVEIVRPLPDSPAEASGIRVGDVILAVDGDSAEGWSVEEAVLRIRGPQGSPVELLIRHLDGEEELIIVVRDEIKLPSVSTIPPGGKLVDKEGDEVDNIAYIRIYSFTRRTPTEIEALLKEITAGEYIGIILDVRGNPGGLLTETTEIVDMFLDEGVIVIEVDRDRNEKTIFATLTIKSMDPSIRVIAYLLDRVNLTHIKRADADEVVVGDDFSAHIVASHVVDPGVPQIANQLMESNSNSRFKRVEIPSQFVGKSYDQLFDHFRKKDGSLLIGVFAEDENLGIGAILSSDASALDNFIERKLKEGGISLQEESKINMVVNPRKGYTLKEGQRAIVIP